MDCIYEDREVMILSDKLVASDNGRIINFTDGSSVDVMSHRIINKGIGDIIIKDLPLWPEMAEILRDQQSFNGIANLIVSGDKNNIILIPDDSPYCTVLLGGADEFVQNTSISQEGDTLYIETPRSNSHLHINMKNIWVNGKRRPPDLGEDFGYIKIKCKGLESLYVNGTGTGEVYSQVPICELKAKIKGSTSIDAIQTKNIAAEISGSGDISITELNGNLRGRISGSGSIDVLNGEINDLDVTVSGSGSLIVGATVNTASLILSGSGEMFVAHVLEEYIEQRTGSGSIRVLRKGRL